MPCHVLVLPTELQELSAEELSEALQSSGLTAVQVEEVTTYLSVLPTVYLKAEFEVDGEEEIMEGDPVKCKVGYGDQACGVVWCMLP